MERQVVDKAKFFKMIGYQPHPKQVDFHRSKARFKVASCGRRFGKTVMTAKDIEPLLLVPNQRVWLVGPTYNLAEKEFRIIWQDMIVKLEFGKDPEIRKAYNPKQGDMFIQFPWGTRIEAHSAERKDTLVGDGLDLVVMCEAAKHQRETWDRMIEPALSDKRGKAIFTSCIVADSMIITEDGIIEIGDLSGGELPGTYVPYERMVAGFHGRMEKATKFYVSGLTPTIKVVTGLGSGIEGTYDHPVWCMRNGVAQWVQLQDLKIGDWLATRVGADVWGNDDDTSDFVKDFNHGNVKDFDTKLTPKLAYLIGYMIGNGYIDFTNNRVSISTAEPIIEKFLQTLGFKQYKSEDNQYGWIIGRKVLVDYLRYLGFQPYKGPSKVIPKRLLKCSRQTIKHILSGLFDADGTAHKTKDSVRFDSSSKRLVEQIQFLLINFGIVGRITRSINGPSEKVNVNSIKYTLEITGAHAQKFHETIGFELKRKQRKLITRPSRFYGVPTQSARIDKLFKKYKAPQGHGRFSKRPNLTHNIDYLRKAGFASYEKLEELLSKLEPYAYDDSDYQYLKTLCNERYYWSQIKSLEQSENNTFDLVIPTTHAFISNTLIMHNTPEGANFFYELWQRGIDDREPEYESWQYPSWDNSVIFPGGLDDPEIQRLKRNMSRDAFEQEIAADFTSFTGKIYKEFMERTHVRKHEYRPDWPNFMSIDFGFVNPLAAIEFQVSPQDTVHVWREYYEPQLTLDEHMLAWRNRENPEGYNIDLIFGDSADPEAIQDICIKFGPCVGDPMAKDNWREGIDLVKTFLKNRGGGVPGFYVDPSCRNTVREFNNYKAAEGGKDRDPREQAKKCDDHAMDAIRYGIMHIFKLGMRVRLSDAVDTTELTQGLPDGGFFTQDVVSRYPHLVHAGFITMDDQRF